ncbi:competence protein ComK [Sporosarcina jiandibaonis]|uniref:competence protein ComK n=1 Tax=Sporosarcina jiandibaonis TaxID=2715535 RepID=UPI001FEA0428|nr:competence protein ComK [Sporosarcina jiandibaonis]
MVVKEFIMNFETILFYPNYDEHGNLQTRILEDRSVFQVDVPPMDLMDTNLKYYGSSLKGASDGASTILGGVSMTPIVVNERRGMYWFPSKSSLRGDCVWFALHQIKHYKSIPEGKTLVTFKNESTFGVDVSYYSFDRKVERAYKLKGKIEGRTNEFPSRVAETRAKYHFNKNNQDLNYDVDKDD